MSEHGKEDKTRGPQLGELIEKRVQLDLAIDDLRQEVTVLYSDIVGYTRFVRDRGDVAGRILLEHHRSLVLPIVTRYGGTFVKTVGDAVMVRFERPGPAVESACLVLRMLREENEEAEEAARFHLRIGIASGKAIIEVDDVNGDVVNIAARLCKMADVDNILVCERTTHGLDRYLAGICVPCPERRVRGIERDKVRAFRVVWNMETSARHRAPESNVLILEASREGDQLKLSLRGNGVGHQTVSRYEFLPWNGPAVEQACSQVIQALKRATSVEGQRSLEQIRSAGSALYDVLLTPDIKHCLRETSCEYLVVRIQDALVKIPWELLYDGRTFLANRFAMGRLVASREKVREREPRPVLRPRLTIISDPCGDLPSAQREGRDLTARLDASERLDLIMKGGAGTSYVRKTLRESDIVN